MLAAPLMAKAQQACRDTKELRVGIIGSNALTPEGWARRASVLLCADQILE